MSIFADQVDVDNLLFKDDADRDAAMLDHDSFGFAESEFLEDSNPRIGGEAHLEGKGFPPKLDKWKTVPFTMEPLVTIDRARTDLWTQGQTGYWR